VRDTEGETTDSDSSEISSFYVQGHQLTLCVCEHWAWWNWKWKWNSSQLVKFLLVCSLNPLKCQHSVAEPVVKRVCQDFWMVKSLDPVMIPVWTGKLYQDSEIKIWIGLGRSFSGFKLNRNKNPLFVCPEPFVCPCPPIWDSVHVCESPHIQ